MVDGVVSVFKLQLEGGGCTTGAIGILAGDCVDVRLLRFARRRAAVSARMASFWGTAYDSQRVLGEVVGFTRSAAWTRTQPVLRAKASIQERNDRAIKVDLRVVTPRTIRRVRPRVTAWTHHTRVLQVLATEWTS